MGVWEPVLNAPQGRRHDKTLKEGGEFFHEILEFFLSLSVISNEDKSIRQPLSFQCTYACGGGMWLARFCTLRTKSHVSLAFIYFAFTMTPISISNGIPHINWERREKTPPTFLLLTLEDCEAQLGVYHP